MKDAARTHDPSEYPPEIQSDRPTAARCYDFTLGGKDNFAVDREFCVEGFKAFPESLDIAHENRRFLYRAVRYLARDVGLKQFLDLGSGLPTQNNVHDVAQEFQPDARVVYVDHDPIVLAHGRAILDKDENTTVIQADMTDPESLLHGDEVRRLIDFSEPVGVLMFSIPHHIPEDADALRAIRTPLDLVVPGSHLAITLVVADEEETARAATDHAYEFGLAMRTRTPAALDAWVGDLDAADPGLCDIGQWRPDPTQGPIEVDASLRPFLGASQQRKSIYEYGGVLRKP
ncbi:SAM-dependent methyltransferase [Spiractinospora alimapuensis]|nr:SAM-dependent methyltransferase [Spiractinospora alimapuensis]